VKGPPLPRDGRAGKRASDHLQRVVAQWGKRPGVERTNPEVGANAKKRTRGGENKEKRLCFEKRNQMKVLSPGSKGGRRKKNARKKRTERSREADYLESRGGS